jgi:hypothetical protein
MTLEHHGQEAAVYHGLWHDAHHVTFARTACYRAHSTCTQLYTQQLCLLCNARFMTKKCLGSLSLDKDKLVGVWSGDAGWLMRVADC